MRGFGTEDGALAIGGVAIGRLADRVGRTPFFAYDRALLTARVAALRNALPADLRLSYAVKANPMPAVVQHLSGLVDSLDVASAAEMAVALDTPLPAERISFAGPGKGPGELAQAVAAGVTIEIESATEADRVAGIGERSGVQPRVAVRVNPDFKIKGSGMRLGGGPQQFGIDSEAVPGVIAEMVARGVVPLGFHIFGGSQNLDVGLLRDAHRKTAELAVRLAEQCDLDVAYLNLGGGLGIPYSESDRALDLEAVGAGLEETMAEVVRPNLPDARTVVELGRYVVGECGVYVTRVLDRKESRGEVFVVVDGGLHHQLAASGNFGQVIPKNYPISVADRVGAATAEKVNVVGCLCTPLDMLGRAVELPRVEIGDLIAIFQAGAYGLTASPTAFLSHPAPAEVLV